MSKTTISMKFSSWKEPFKKIGRAQTSGGGGGHSLTWAIRGRAAGQGMVFWPLS